MSADIIVFHRRLSRTEIPELNSFDNLVYDLVGWPADIAANTVINSPRAVDPSKLELDRFTNACGDLLLEYKQNSAARRADICLQLEALLKLVKP